MDPSEVIALVLGTLTSFSIVLGALAWWIRQTVRNEIAAFTRPIQPGYRNGGDSLSDVSHRMRRIEAHLGIEEA